MNYDRFEKLSQLWLLKCLAVNHKWTIQEISTHFNWNPANTQDYINDLISEGVGIDKAKSHTSDDLLDHISVNPDNGNVYEISKADSKNRTMKFGVISDLHFASKFHLPKTFEYTMKRFEDEGVKKVYVAARDAAAGSTLTLRYTLDGSTSFTQASDPAGGQATINNSQYEINAYTINQDCQSIALKLDSSGKIDINDINIDYRLTNKRPRIL